MTSDGSTFSYHLAGSQCSPWYQSPQHNSDYEMSAKSSRSCLLRISALDPHAWLLPQSATKLSPDMWDCPESRATTHPSEWLDWCVGLPLHHSMRIGPAKPFPHIIGVGYSVITDDLVIQVAKNGNYLVWFVSLPRKDRILCNGRLSLYCSKCTERSHPFASKFCREGPSRSIASYTC